MFSRNGQFTNRTNRRQTSRYSALKCAVLLAACCVACGMNGSSCNVTMPGGGGGGGSNGPTILLQQNDHFLGSANAKVVVIEYGDFECPFCGSFARMHFPTFRSQYVDTGMVRWVFRHFPLRNIHSRAEPAARASECASDQGDFVVYHDLIYNTTDANGTILTDDQLRDHAQTMGLDLTTFDACYPPGNSKSTRVQTDVNSGTALGVTGTPTFFVGIATNATTVSNADTVAGAVPDDLMDAIDRKLAESQ